MNKGHDNGHKSESESSVVKNKLHFWVCTEGGELLEVTAARDKKNQLRTDPDCSREFSEEPTQNV